MIISQTFLGILQPCIALLISLEDLKTIVVIQESLSKLSFYVFVLHGLICCVELIRCINAALVAACFYLFLVAFLAFSYDSMTILAADSLNSCMISFLFFIDGSTSLLPTSPLIINLSLCLLLLALGLAAFTLCFFLPTIGLCFPLAAASYFSVMLFLIEGITTVSGTLSTDARAEGWPRCTSKMLLPRFYRVTPSPSTRMVSLDLLRLAVFCLFCESFVPI